MIGKGTKGLLIFLAAVSLSIALLAGTRPGAGSLPGSSWPEGVARVFTRDGRVLELRVEIADTLERRAKGLMGRRRLAEGAGMAFVFPEPTGGAFWMKDTLIPLSIAFVAAGGEITAILDMDPCAEEPCPLYSPGAPYLAALEVRQGWFRRHGVGPGDRVAIEPFASLTRP